MLFLFCIANLMYTSSKCVTMSKARMIKQTKITKMFRKQANKESDDCHDLEEEIRQLEQKLSETHNEFFQIQRSKYRQKVSPPKRKEDSFIRPEKVVLGNSVDSLKNNLELMSMLTGLEVQSYETGDHCCILFYMQHRTDKEVKHGLRIDMECDKNTVTKSSLPVGFNFNAILEDYSNILKPECLYAIRNGLVAYYGRLEQYNALKTLLVIDAELFKILDGSHIEITFLVQSGNEEDEEQIHITLILDYRVYDIRPKSYCFDETELPDGAAEALKHQCAVFKKKPLQKAFKMAFLSGIGPYNLVSQLAVGKKKPESRQRHRPQKHYNNDDTFLPEDCSEQEDAECE